MSAAATATRGGRVRVVQHGLTGRADTRIGSFGVVATVVGFLFVMVTMSLACAVFSPVWEEWRRAEKQRRDRQSIEAADKNPVGA